MITVSIWEFLFILLVTSLVGVAITIYALNKFINNQFYELNYIYTKIHKEYETVNKLVTLKDLEVNRAIISDNTYNRIMKVLNKGSE